MKEYTFDDFQMNTYAYKTITEDGRVRSDGISYAMNTSSILTRLIQEAGRFCERFASDLFIDWQNIITYTLDDTGAFERSFLLGFRENGVDHTEYVFSRYDSEGKAAKHNYRSMWRLDFSANGKECFMVLGRVF